MTTARFPILLGLLLLLPAGRLLAQDDAEPKVKLKAHYEEEEIEPTEDDAATARDPFVAKAKARMKMLDETYGEGFFDYLCDDGVMPRPYLVAVEHKDNVDLDTVRAEFADIFGSLYEVYYHEFGNRIGAKPIKDPVVVLIYDSKDSYKEMRESRPELHLPNEEFMNGYYQPGTGILTQWRHESLWKTLFHEGTHQLVDCSSKEWSVSQWVQCPWFQEGFADYMGGHDRKLTYSEEKGKFVNEFTLGQFIKNRYAAVQQAFLEGKEMSTKELVYYDFMRFKAAQNNQEGNPENQRITGAIYAQGWALVMFLNYYEDGTYKDCFERYLEAELTGHGGGDKFAEILYLETDEDWEDFDAEFREFIFGDLRRMGREHRQKK